jgi:hypothetical protein
MEKRSSSRSQSPVALRLTASSSSISGSSCGSDQSSPEGEMAYGRRNFIAHQRGGSIVAPSRSLAAYRNKIAFILAVTVLYTAFLYKSG